MLVRRRSALAVVPLLASALAFGALTAVPAGATAPSTAPVPVSPLAGDPAVTPTPVFNWQPVLGAAKYRFQVSTSSGFSALAYDVTTYGLHATPPTPLPSGDLYWHVSALDALGAAGPYSDTVQFTVGAASGPVLTAPDDAATLTYPTTPPVLVWQPVAGAKTYTIEVDEDSAFTSVATYSTANSQLALTEPPALDTTQYWRVRAQTGNSSTTDWSVTRSFSVGWPGIPVAQSPTNGATITSLRLAWSAVAGAKTYEVQISTSSDFQSGLQSLGTSAQNITGTQYAPLVALQPQAYFWRVRAKDDASPTQHLGGWSDTSSYTLAVIAAPTALTPGLDVSQQGTPPFVSQPRLSWSGSSRASSYEVQVGTDQNFSSPLTYTDCTTFHTSLTPYFGVTPSATDCDIPLSAQQYFWRVRGINVYNGTWSPTMAFFFDPAAPNMTSPANGSTTSQPVLRWDPVTGYHKYKVTISKGATTQTFLTFANSYTPLAASASGFGVAAGSYTWTVQAVAANGDLGPAPAARTYNLVAATGQAELTATAPVGASNEAMPSLEWTALTGATGYRPYYRAAGASVWIPFAATKGVLTAYTEVDDPLSPGDYEWMVEALDDGNTILASTAAAPQAFTVLDLPRVTYTGPTNCLVDIACTAQSDVPTLSWDAVSYAFKYRVHLATDPTFANELPFYDTQFTSITPLTQLPDNQAGQSYYWFVQPCKSDLVCGPFQDGFQSTYEQSFRKSTPKVVAIAPADAGAVGDDPHLSWEDYFPTGQVSSPVAGARRYHLQVSTRSDFATLADEQTLEQTSYTPFTKEYADGTYYWRVQAMDGAGQALTYSDVRTFVKSSLTPVLDGVTTTTPLPTLTWGALPYVGSYLVEVYPGLNNTTGSLAIPQATTKLPAFTPTAPLAKGDYTWRVAKKDPNSTSNRGPWSTPSSFTVALSPPALQTPLNGVLIGSDDLVFTWTLPTGTTTAYRLDTSTSSSFPSNFETQVLTGTTWASPKKYVDNTPYYWRVSALDNASPAHVLATSATRTFTKDSTAPLVLSVNPLKDLPLTGVSATVTFNEPVNGVSGSSLKVYPKGAPSLVVAGAVTVAADKKSATFTPSGPLVPGRWYTVSLGSSITDIVGNHLVATTFDRRAALVVDSSSPVVREYWDTDTASAASGGAFATSKLAGTSLAYSFTGTSVQLLGTKGVLGGYANVYVDNGAATKVSFYRSSTAYQQVVYTKSGMTNAAHTIKVVVVGGTPPTGSKGTYVYVDALKIGSATVQEGSTRQAFNRVVTGSATGGSYEREFLDPSGDTGGKPEYRMVFDGSAVDIYAVRAPTNGKARIYVDNVFKGDADFFGSYPTYNYKVYAVSGLDPTKAHTVRVVFLGTKATSSKGYGIQIDGFVLH